MSTGLTDVTDRLANVLTQENDALKRLDFAAAVALVSAKEAALADFANQPKMAAIPPPLAALGNRLGRLATENQVLLERAIAVQTRIVRIIARACAPAPEAARYGGDGARAPSHRTTAVALSTRV